MSHRRHDHQPEGSADFYATLQVRRSASSDEIRKAYKRLALQYHPDKNPGSRDAEEKFKAVSRAYEVLSNEQTRRVYDVYGMDGLINGAAGPSQPASRRAREPHPTDVRSDDDFFFAHSHTNGRQQHQLPAGMRPFHFAAFDFHDPFEVFRQFFGGGDPFAGLGGFGGPTSFGMLGDPLVEDPFFRSAFGMLGGDGARQPRQRDAPRNLGRGSLLGNMLTMSTAAVPSMMGTGGGFESMMDGFGGIGHSTQSSMVSFSSFGGGGTRKSVRTTTEVRDGLKITRTITTTTDARGNVHEDVDERIEELPPHQQGRRVSGPPSLSSSRAGHQLRW